MMLLASNRLKRLKDTTCIVSIDKDLDMIPGHHYNPKKDVSYYINEQDGYRNFYKQCLTGDTSDNIPGIYGIGPKGAARIVDVWSREHAMWQAVEGEWHKHYPDGLGGKSAGDAVREVASLLWISRSGGERWSEPK
jgi:hypothetical protein